MRAGRPNRTEFDATSGTVLLPEHGPYWWGDTRWDDLIYYDANGDSVKIDRWHEITFPNHPPKVNAIEIL